LGLRIAHLGPPGTYAEAAALACAGWLAQKTGRESVLCSCASIAQTLRSLHQGQAQLAVVPVENSIEGSVTMTLDTLWQLDTLQIQFALVMPIVHALLSHASNLQELRTVYSHPQALSQCQEWMERHLPTVQLIPTHSTTEALQSLVQDKTAGAVASQRAAELYNLPILACPINDYPDNCTRFWLLGQEALAIGSDLVKSDLDGSTYTSLAVSVPANVPGALVKLLQIFAERNINLSRIESRPTKRSLGDYLFFMDLEADGNNPIVQTALAELATHTEKLKIFGSYRVLPISVRLT